MGQHAERKREEGSEKRATVMVGFGVGVIIAGGGLPDFQTVGDRSRVLLMLMVEAQRRWRNILLDRASKVEIVLRMTGIAVIAELLFFWLVRLSQREHCCCISLRHTPE